MSSFERDDQGVKLAIKRLIISISRAPLAAAIAVLASSVAFLPTSEAAKAPKKVSPKPTATPLPTPVPTPAPELPAPKLKLKRDLPASQKPFWKTRQSVLKRMKEDRAVFVVVKRDDLKNDLVRLTMQGAGYVQRPKDFCFKVSQDYPRLKEISDHFRTVSFDPQTNQLYLIMEALGYQERMVMKVTPVSEDWRSELQWEVTWGHFTGMKGLIGFEQIESGVTEMSLSAVYEAKELPLPKILMGFALEVISQKVAERMRTFIEAQPMPVATAISSPSSLKGASLF